MAFTITSRRGYLIATLRPGLTHDEWSQLRYELLLRVERQRKRGVILDATELDVLDSFLARMVRSLAMEARLLGAETVIAGIQPEVAIAMVKMGLNLKLENVSTALDLAQGLALLDSRTKGARHHK